MKLKTLKDLKWLSSDTSEFIEEDIKQTAIKWVKGDIEGSWRQIFLVFFNITEEDLKLIKKQILIKRLVSLNLSLK